MNEANILQGQRIRLAALEQDDLAAIADWYQDAGLLRLLDAVPSMPRTQNELQGWMSASHKAKDTFLFAVRPVDENRLLGFVEFDGILWNHQTGWLSVAIGDRDNWEQGYGSEALALALRFAFHELNLHRVSLNVFGYNRRAIAIYEKLGFQKEGAQREAIHRDGERHDMIYYGLLRRDWERLQSDS